MRGILPGGGLVEYGEAWKSLWRASTPFTLRFFKFFVGASSVPGFKKKIVTASF
jgi:hypothetical protein